MRGTVLSALALIAALSGTAHASGMPKIIGDEYVLVGLSVGFMNDGQSSRLTGIEISYNRHLHDVTFAGVYGDLRYDPVNEGVMIAAGPQIFGALVGIDAGLLLRTGRLGHGGGFRGRACLSAIVVSACGGGGWESVRGGFGELSLLFKAPGELR